jgi:fructokinase
MKPRILCLGEILFDYLADRVGSSLTEVNSWTPYPGGAPANVACALTKLGTPAAFIGCVGKDRAGTELVQLLQSTGIDTTGVQYHHSAPTRQVYVLRQETGERVFAGFGDYAPNQFADAFLEATKLPEELFGQADFLVLGTLELAYPQSRKAVFHALELAQRYHLKVVVDINWRPLFWLNLHRASPLLRKMLAYADFVKLSQEEAQHFYQTAEAGAIAHNFDSLEGVIVTAGEGKVSYCLCDHQGTVTPPPVKVVDTTGAGDAFLAAFIHQLDLRGMKALKDPNKVQEIISYACAVGSLTTTKKGAIAAQPTATEVEQFLWELGV